VLNLNDLKQVFFEQETQAQLEQLELERLKTEQIKTKKQKDPYLLLPQLIQTL
jgi:hypothetical protein